MKHNRLKRDTKSLSSVKFLHYPSCKSVDQMKEKNKQGFYGSREEAIEQGYVPCKNCNP